MPTVSLLIEWVALTAIRTVEARLSTWSEIDTDAAVWSIPADKTKTGDPHRVALSPPALTILHKARRQSGPHGLVFPSRTGKPISHGTPSQVFRKLEIPGTIHGLRSSFRTWPAEAGYPREVCEAALGHRTGSAVEVAYSRVVEPRGDCLVPAHLIKLNTSVRLTRRSPKPRVLTPPVHHKRGLHSPYHLWRSLKRP